MDQEKLQNEGVRDVTTDTATDTTAVKKHVYTEEEKKRMRRKKRIKRLKRKLKKIFTPTTFIGIALVLLLIGACASFIIARQAEKNKDLEYEAEMDRLAYRKSKLMAELDKLGPDVDKQLGNTAYMSFLFTSIDKALFDEVYPIMEDGENDLDAIMAFSPTNLPGQDGKITKEQYERLVKHNDYWGTAIYWDGEGDISEYISYMFSLLDGIGIDRPSTMAFKPGTYKGEYDDVLALFGIRNAIHSGETGLPHRVSGAPEGVWHPGAVGWKAGMSATLLKRQVEAEGGYAILEINFNTSLENAAYSFFDVPGETAGTRIESFRTMINLFKMSVKMGDIEVLNLDKTREKMEKYYSERTEIELQHAQRRKEINIELQDIERRMTELYVEYYG